MVQIYCKYEIHMYLVYKLYINLPTWVSELLVFALLAVAFPPRLQLGGCVGTEATSSNLQHIVCQQYNGIDASDRDLPTLTETVFPGLQCILCGKQGLWEANEDFGSKWLWKTWNYRHNKKSQNMGQCFLFYRICDSCQIWQIRFDIFIRQCGWPAHFVLLRLVSQVFDQCGNSIWQLPVPVRPRAWTQGLVSKHKKKKNKVIIWITSKTKRVWLFIRQQVSQLFL